MKGVQQYSQTFLVHELERFIRDTNNDSTNCMHTMSPKLKFKGYASRAQCLCTAYIRKKLT